MVSESLGDITELIQRGTVGFLISVSAAGEEHESWQLNAVSRLIGWTDPKARARTVCVGTTAARSFRPVG